MNTINQMKNIIVLKDLPSNLIEEAFVILKPNKKVKINSNLETGEKEKEHSEEYIIKEAEMVINSYLSNVENETKIRNRAIKKMEIKYKKLKTITTFLAIVFIINIALNLIIK